MITFPFQAKLISEPDNQYAAANMRVGEAYTVFDVAGSCYIVSTDVPDDRTMIWRGRLEPVVDQQLPV